MYAGLTLTRFSGRIFGAHQRIDRIARRALNEMLTDQAAFPSKKLLLHFEGKNGPDGLKLKSTGRDEAWHYYDPFDPEDGHLLELIEEHYNNLVRELKNRNIERAAFEASWLAHAILDGLTPSHHYPYEKELENIRGEGKETRTTYFKKVIISGESSLQTVANNWKVWGFKGLFLTHYNFELGAASVFATVSKRIARPNRYEIKTLQHLGLIEYYKRIAREVAVIDMYDEFYKRGWTSKLAKTVKKELAPRMAVMTTLAWYLAAHEAGIATGEV